MATSLKFKCDFHDFAPLMKGNTYQILTDSITLNKVYLLILQYQNIINRDILFRAIKFSLIDTMGPEISKQDEGERECEKVGIMGKRINRNALSLFLA